MNPVWHRRLKVLAIVTAAEAAALAGLSVWAYRQINKTAGPLED